MPNPISYGSEPPNNRKIGYLFTSLPISPQAIQTLNKKNQKREKNWWKRPKVSSLLMTPVAQWSILLSVAWHFSKLGQCGRVLSFKRKRVLESSWPDTFVDFKPIGFETHMEWAKLLWSYFCPPILHKYSLNTWNRFSLGHASTGWVRWNGLSYIIWVMLVGSGWPAIGT